MRPIIFRYLSRHTGEWVYSNDPNLTESVFWDNVDVDSVPETLSQFTGLKDKNGNNIFEGDVLTSKDYPFQHDGKYNYHGIVEWIPEHAAFFLTKRLVNKSKSGISDGISEPLMDYDTEDFEVIGNIHQNPKLASR